MTTYTVTARQFNIADSPLYFVRNGYVYANVGLLWLVGIDGYSSSRSGRTIDDTFILGFNASIVRPSHGPYPRSDGFSVRCLAE